MVTVEIVNGSEDDVILLANMNKQLIEDEKHDNSMNIDELKERMRGFLSTDFKAYYFKSEGNLVGYALVNIKQKPLYLRKFYICRNFRRMKYGTEAFKVLLNVLGTEEIELDVLTWNERGIRFWKSLGFEERTIYMRYKK